MKRKGYRPKQAQAFLADALRRCKSPKDVEGVVLYAVKYRPTTKRQQPIDLAAIAKLAEVRLRELEAAKPRARA